MLKQWKLAYFALLLILAGCVTLSLQDEIAALMKEGQQLHSEKKYDAAIDKFLVVISKDPQHWQAYFWAARSFIAKGGWAEAIANARKAFQMAPKDREAFGILAEALFGGALDALGNGRHAEAISHFVDYLKLEPGNAKAWLNVGKAYLAQKQFAEALNAFQQGLAQEGGQERSELLRALLDGGRQAYAGGQYRDAIGLLKEYVHLDNRNVAAYVSLARSYLESGDAGNAIETFGKVLKLDPRHEEALRFLLKR